MHIQNDDKKRYEFFCNEAIGEVCIIHKIEIILLEVADNHVYMIVDCPRIMGDVKLLQILKSES